MNKFILPTGGASALSITRLPVSGGGSGVIEHVTKFSPGARQNRTIRKTSATGAGGVAVLGTATYNGSFSYLPSAGTTIALKKGDVFKITAATDHQSVTDDLLNKVLLVTDVKEEVDYENYDNPIALTVTFESLVEDAANFGRIIKADGTEVT